MTDYLNKVDYPQPPGPYNKDRRLIKESFVPHIEDIRVLIGADGQEYINIRDLAVAMRMMAYKTAPTLSVFNFIKQLTIELLTARR